MQIWLYVSTLVLYEITFRFDYIIKYLPVLCESRGSHIFHGLGMMDKIISFDLASVCWIQ